MTWADFLALVIGGGLSGIMFWLVHEAKREREPAKFDDYEELK